MRLPLSLRLAIRSGILLVICILIVAFSGHMTRLYAQSIVMIAFLGIAVSGLLSLWGMISGFIEIFSLPQKSKSLLAIGINACLMALAVWRLLLMLSASQLI